MRIVSVGVFALILLLLGFDWTQIFIVCLASFFVYGVLIPTV